MCKNNVYMVKVNYDVSPHKIRIKEFYTIINSSAIGDR